MKLSETILLQGLALEKIAAMVLNVLWDSEGPTSCDRTYGPELAAGSTPSKAV